MFVSYILECFLYFVSDKINIRNQILFKYSTNLLQQNVFDKLIIKHYFLIYIFFK